MLAGQLGRPIHVDRRWLVRLDVRGEPLGVAAEHKVGAYEQHRGAHLGGAGRHVHGAHRIHRERLGRRLLASVHVRHRGAVDHHVRVNILQRGAHRTRFAHVYRRAIQPDRVTTQLPHQVRAELAVRADEHDPHGSLPLTEPYCSS
jgi:hypothetical protein